MRRLLFVDTNIYLDFYRARTEAGLALLKHLVSVGDKIIMTWQIQMEFEKNRQAVLLETIRSLEVPLQIQRPALLSDDQTLKALQKDLAKVKKKAVRLRTRLLRVLHHPANYDPVYKIIGKLLSKKDEISVWDGHPKQATIRRLAIRRFLEGRPPRKPTDLSVGDAINWEWIVHVAASQKANVTIVSRDSDYGTIQDNQGYPNDWLVTEFRSRSGLRRKISLYPLLSKVLKEFSVKVTPGEENEEQSIAAPHVFRPALVDLTAFMQSVNPVVAQMARQVSEFSQAMQPVSSQLARQMAEFTRAIQPVAAQYAQQISELNVALRRSVALVSKSGKGKQLPKKRSSTATGKNEKDS